MGTGMRRGSGQVQVMSLRTPDSGATEWTKPGREYVGPGAAVPPPQSPEPQLCPSAVPGQGGATEAPAASGIQEFFCYQRGEGRGKERKTGEGGAREKRELCIHSTMGSIALHTWFVGCPLWHSTGHLHPLPSPYIPGPPHTQNGPSPWFFLLKGKLRLALGLASNQVLGRRAYVNLFIKTVLIFG